MTAEPAVLRRPPLDSRTHDELIHDHTPLARRLAQRFTVTRDAQDDLVQVAMLGLVKAARRFDPGRGVKFITFATVTITGELRRHFRDNRWGLHVPRSLQEGYLQLREAANRLSQELDRSPTIAELAREADMTEEAVIEATDAGIAFRVASLDAPVDDATIQVGGPGAGLAEVETRAWLVPLLRRLPERQQRIVRLRFVDQLTQYQIARQLGLSQMHVSRLLNRSLAQLRAWMVDAPA